MCVAAQAVDIEIQAKEIMFHKANLNRIMAECTGQPVEQARAPLATSQLLCLLHLCTAGLLWQMVGTGVLYFLSTLTSGCGVDLARSKRRCWHLRALHPHDIMG